jgi:hypothetical protein
MQPMKIPIVSKSGLKSHGSKMGYSSDVAWSLCLGLGLSDANSSVRLRGAIFGIPLRLENPKIGGVDDAEIVGDRIAEDRPVSWYLLAQEM